MDFRSDDKPEVSCINETEVSVPDLYRVGSRVSTTKHCFKCKVVIVNFDNVEASNVSVLAMFEIWRNIISQSQKSYIDCKVFFGKVEWEVFLELELNFCLENRGRCRRKNLQSIFVHIFHFYCHCVSNGDIVNDNFDGPGLS